MFGGEFILQVEQTKDELIYQVKTQMRYLSVSSSEFDKGFHDEAQRMATTIRVLLHDTKHQKSLLSQLNIKECLYFYDTVSKTDSGKLVVFTGLLAVAVLEGKPYYKAPLFDEKYPSIWTNFDEWWNRIVFKDTKGVVFTRKDIILNLADKDGGAHIDPWLKKEYYNFSRKNSLGWAYLDGKTRRNIEGNPVQVSMRQICFEFMWSVLKSKNPVLLTIDFNDIKLQKSNYNIDYKCDIWLRNIALETE